MSLNFQKEIINLYMQFLSELNCNIQICISNKKVDAKKYISDHFSNKSEQINSELYNEYINELKLVFENENIYETFMYLIISQNSKTESNISDIRRKLVKLERIGCKVCQINNKKELKELLYKLINKEKG